jgi:hypothetical protein
MLKHHRTVFFLYVRDQVSSSCRTMCKIMVVNRDKLQKCAVCSNTQLLGLLLWNVHWQVSLEFVSTFLACCEHNLPYTSCTQKQIKQDVRFFTSHSNMTRHSASNWHL